MLNELLLVEEGVNKGGFAPVQRNPAIMDVGKTPALLVQLDPGGSVAAVRAVPTNVTAWTLRDGQHNSFPFVQPKKKKEPFWTIPTNPENESDRISVSDKKNKDRLGALMRLTKVATFNSKASEGWIGSGLINRLRERRLELRPLEGTKWDFVLAAMDRFLLACEKADGPRELLLKVVEKLLENLHFSAREECLEIAAALLLGSFDKKTKQWKCSGALLFEAVGSSHAIYDPRIIPALSEALSCSKAVEKKESSRVCGLTGLPEQLLDGNFPQPNLPVLGQTYLFSKNKDIPANGRYGKFASDAMPVGRKKAVELAAALCALTDEKLKGTTWRSIPGEAPKKSDLLLAFVNARPDVAVALVLTEEDYSEEEDADPIVDSIAAFKKRTRRVVELVKANVSGDLNEIDMNILVFRRVDRGNRKVILSGRNTVQVLYTSAEIWAEGELNVPPWLVLSVWSKGESKPRNMHPPHIAPLGMISFSKQLFMRDGTSRQEITGITASEALGLFLDSAENSIGRIRRVLNLVLHRRDALVINFTHGLHTPGAWKKHFEFLNRFDRWETLRSVTVIGILLYKLGRRREAYMNETAFKLGQLLAAADIVHAGYCADVRGGDVPPSLLGNQVFTMAQTDPVKALATLCRRWKPYDGWAKKVLRDKGSQKKLNDSKNKEEEQKVWDIRRALRCAREMKVLALEISPELTKCHADDVFRAELLLGYLAGLPKSQKEGLDHQDETTRQEDEDGIQG